MTDELERDGFAVVPGVLSPAECGAVVARIEAALAEAEGPAIRGGEGTVYAARNVLAVWPPAASVWQRPTLLGPVRAILGEGCGIVRALYFDKPPGNSWALPWHQDLTVAVRDNRLPSTHFRRPTTKAGVPHAEAPVEVLRRMLTLRLHLDDVTDENGPLKVLAGSHRAGKSLDLSGEVRVVYAAAGDVLLMRPLLAHCSNRSKEGTARHRRILHLELSAAGPLPDGYEWHTFEPVRMLG